MFVACGRCLYYSRDSSFSGLRMDARLIWVIFLKGGEIFIFSVEIRTSVQTTRPPSRRLLGFLAGSEAAVLLSCM